jgi:VanZ family protein
MFGLAILTLSSMPHLKAPEIGWWAGDKLAHFIEYAVFAFLLHRSFGKLGPPDKSWFAWGTTLLFVAIFALIDETWQSFVPGRFSDRLDWLADFSGGAVTVALLILLEWRRRPNLP